MTKPMILGGSVSSGLDGTSFIEPLAEKYSVTKKVIREAYPGFEGSVILGYKSFTSKVQSASVVIALDLFYWDQFNCRLPNWNEENSKAIATLFQKTVKQGVPLLVGNLPRKQAPFDKVAHENPCADSINLKLKTLCDQSPTKCLMVENAEIATKVNEYFVPVLAALKPEERSLFARAKLTRDGIHPRSEAYRVIADIVNELLVNSTLQCK